MWPHIRPSDKPPRGNSMISHWIMPTDSPFLFPLPCHDSLLGQNTRSISLIFPLWLAMTSSLGQSPRYWLPIYISDVSSFGAQSLLTILLLVVSSYSNPSTYGNMGTFLAHLSIVLSLRKAPIGLVYRPVYVFPCPLASSTHQLPSNLVSPLRLPLVSSLHQLSDDYMVDL